ncbi:MAG: hypothetical protein K0R17_3183 [Rariglobus sp.]|nr:hypothetical protein [Rariglobus sp.]
MGVAQAGKEFVQRVEGNPDAVQGERRGLDAAFVQRDEGGLGDGKDVAVTIGGLAVGEPRDKVIDPRENPGVTGGGVKVAEGGEIVAERVTADVARLPAAIAFGDRREAGLGAERCEQAVGIDGFEVARMNVLPLLERAIEQAHGGEGQGIRDAGNATEPSGVDDGELGHGREEWDGWRSAWAGWR